MTKTLNRAMRILIASLAAVAMMLVTNPGSRCLASSPAKQPVVSNAEKHVQIIVELHGDIDHHTVESVAELVGEWLAAAHFAVSHSDGADYLHLHISVNVTANHHFAVHSDCGGWHEDKDAAVVDAIDDILHHMVRDFIDKYSH